MKCLDSNEIKFLEFDEQKLKMHYKSDLQLLCKKLEIKICNNFSKSQLINLLLEYKKNKTPSLTNKSLTNKLFPINNIHKPTKPTKPIHSIFFIIKYVLNVFS